MDLATGFIMMCAIISLGAIALVGFALWIFSHDDGAPDRREKLARTTRNIQGDGVTAFENVA